MFYSHERENQLYYSEMKGQLFWKEGKIKIVKVLLNCDRNSYCLRLIYGIKMLLHY